MGKYGAIQNAISNNRKLAFAWNTLDRQQFMRLYESYTQLRRWQLAVPIVFAAIVILEWIFIPAQEVPNGYADFKTTLILFETVGFALVVFPLWLIITQFTVGKLWHKFDRWYRKSSYKHELYEIFE